MPRRPAVGFAWFGEGLGGDLALPTARRPGTAGLDLPSEVGVLELDLSPRCALLTMRRRGTTLRDAARSSEAGA